MNNNQEMNTGIKSMAWSLIAVFVLQIFAPVAYAAQLNEQLSYEPGAVLMPIVYENPSDMGGSASETVKMADEIEMENSAAKRRSEVKAIDLASIEKLSSVTMAAGGGDGYNLGSTGDLVNQFTGDFSYAIPLMDVEGFPLTLTYNSNVSMFQEASWVGLGWDLDLGSVSRQLNGIPDEFNGDDYITRTYNQRKDETDGHKYGGYLSAGYIKFLLSPQLQLTLLGGKYNNNYIGQGRTFDIGLQAALSLSDKDEKNSIAASFGIGYSRDTKGGVGFNNSYGLSASHGPGKNDNGGAIGANASFGKSYNSRMGLMDKEFSAGLEGGYQRNNGKKLEGDFTASVSTSTSLSYGTISAMPRVSLSSVSSSSVFLENFYAGVKTANWVVKAGFIGQQFNASSDLQFSSSNQLLEPLYGYLHSGKRYNAPIQAGIYPLMDFNRSADFDFSEEMKNLSFSTQAFDVWRVSGGISGTFRAGRTDVGTYCDPTTSNILNSGSQFLIDDDISGVNGGVLVSTSPVAVNVELGYSSGIQPGQTISGIWDSPLNFNAVSAGYAFDPTTYFKAVGEKTPVDLSAYNALNGTAPDYIDINKSGSSIVSSSYLKQSSQTISGSTINSLAKKPMRATSFRPRTAEDMTASGMPAAYTNYYSMATNGTVTSFSRFSGIRKKNHISQIDVVSTDGVQYQYGIASYSVKSAEVVFSTGPVTDNPSSVLNKLPNVGMVEYNSSDASVSNNRGSSNYYDHTEMPAYPSEFLLTSITGSDYVDRGLNGPTVDDIGSYVKFNYTKVYSESNPYKWRFPISGISGSGATKKAVLNKGLLGIESDDMGSYTYGEREVWYVQSIEGKNLIAVFTLTPREDAYGVTNEDGFIDTGASTKKQLQKLSKIQLFSKNDYLVNGPTNAKALQTVEFVYDYSLCLNAPSNPATYTSPGSAASGKLTLTKIRIYTGSSVGQSTNKYEFTYSSDNPGYNSFNVDAWGNYKPNNTSKPNDLYPYSEQDQSLANQYAQSWKLVAIDNPLGGRTEISYQADTYAYVQDKRAMRHFEIAGMMNMQHLMSSLNSSSWSGPTGGTLTNNFRSDVTPPTYSFAPKYSNAFGGPDYGTSPNNVVVFKLETAISGSVSASDANQKVKDQYFKDPSNGSEAYLKELFFKSYVSVKPGVVELIPTFATISPDLDHTYFITSTVDIPAIGVLPIASGQTSYTYGYVILSPVNTNTIESSDGKDEDPFDVGSSYFGFSMHPLQRNAIDFIRQNLTEVVYGTCLTCDGELDVDKKALWGNNIYQFMVCDADYLPQIFCDKSLVRLYEPDNKKMGGNARVSRIKYLDKWGTISSETYNDGIYTWSYTYPNEREAEKGVASFEPRGMIDENPFYHWNTFYNIAKKFPDETKFHPTPIAQALFPIGEVGYEEVQVQFNGSESKGYSKAKFHTAKEMAYRTKEESTTIDKSAAVKKHNVLTGKSVDLFGFTQGYSVQTNDFHGQPDEFLTYDGAGNIQARTSYEYYGLGEKIPMIDRKGVVTMEDVAQEADIHVDSRFTLDESKYQLAGLTLGVKFSVPPSVYVRPSYSWNSREKGFYSTTLIKHINRSAVVKKITTEYLASKNEAENLLYDKYTGNTVLSSLNDEFDDKLYTFNYPSHWAYPELREMEYDYSTNVSGNIVSGGQFTVSSGTNLLNMYSSGDIVLVTQGSSTYQAYVLSIFNFGNQAYLIDASGNALSVTGNVSMKIVKSNHSNRLNESMENTVTKKPITVAAGNFTFPVNEIISSSAINYKDKNSLNCSNVEGLKLPNNVANGTINPFLYGAKGDLMINTSFSWQSERVNATHNHGIRFDGTYSSFTPYYSLDANFIWQEINPLSHWRKSGTIVKYNEFGDPIEAKDVINVKSTVLYGYSDALKALPVAQAANASNKEVAFDGFEDYNYSTGAYFAGESHFSFNGVTNATVDGNNHHSGLKSVKIAGGLAATVVKPITVVCDEGRYDTGNPENWIIGSSSCNCMPPFSPVAGATYVVGVWIKQTRNNAGSVKVIFKNGATIIGLPYNYEFFAQGPVIDGWQRVDAVFTVPPSGATSIEVSLNNNGSDDVFFDDFRIHPELASMSTTVYDPLTLLPIATHDGYNYTTFYNYDENLDLVRIRLETLDGIKTISEQESSISKD